MEVEFTSLEFACLVAPNPGANGARTFWMDLQLPQRSPPRPILGCAPFGAGLLHLRTLRTERAIRGRKRRGSVRTVWKLTGRGVKSARRLT